MGEPAVKTRLCEMEGCDHPYLANGMCRMHYERVRRGALEPRITHGHIKGGKKSPTYQSWIAMRTRCLNPNAFKYPFYGGRGITICDRWLTFDNFLADMGLRPRGTSLDRIDPAGNYEPGNCRWATALEQRHNRRDTVNN